MPSNALNLRSIDHGCWKLSWRLCMWMASGTQYPDLYKAEIAVLWCLQTEALATAAVRAATKLQAALIVVFTVTGRTASLIAKYRPQQPILTVSCSVSMQHLMNTLWLHYLPCRRTDGLAWAELLVALGLTWLASLGFVHLQHCDAIQHCELTAGSQQHSAAVCHRPASTGGAQGQCVLHAQPLRCRDTLPPGPHQSLCSWLL